ncbi:type IV toxin-antitoxin system AbiEi family antitoxin domain-containing protein [Mycobacterium avium]|nr:type IV toxin-antitoxin system AbiEi family antitoxin domain-containing protein [Mycobacterium avium]
MAGSVVSVLVADELADAAAGQWGMFTTEQAHRLGLTSDQMAELGAAHRISRTETPGVYRFAGVPMDVTLDALRATWLSLDPAALASERIAALRSGGPGAIVSHVSAAHYVYELGTLHPARLDYTVPAAPEASSPRVEFHVAECWSPPWQLVGGLPVTPVPQTIADVYRDGIDGGHLGDILRDVLARALADVRVVAAELDPWASGQTGRDVVMHALAVVGAPASVAAGNELLFSGVGGN